MMLTGDGKLQADNAYFISLLFCWQLTADIIKWHGHACDQKNASKMRIFKSMGWALFVINPSSTKPIFCWQDKYMG